jgi:hypothetical protein
MAACPYADYPFHFLLPDPIHCLDFHDYLMQLTQN